MFPGFYFQHILVWAFASDTSNNIKTVIIKDGHIYKKEELWYDSVRMTVVILLIIVHQ
jgi:hypothetical protein